MLLMSLLPLLSIILGITANKIRKTSKAPDARVCLSLCIALVNETRWRPFVELIELRNDDAVWFLWDIVVDNLPHLQPTEQVLLS